MTALKIALMAFYLDISNSVIAEAFTEGRFGIELLSTMQKL